MQVWRSGVTSLFLCLALALVVAVQAQDEIWLSDGSKLVGQVTAIQGGKLTVKTDFAGDLAVDAAKVKGLSTDGRRVVTMPGGDRVSGQLVYSPEKGQRLEGTKFGGIDLKLADVSGLWAEGQEPVAGPVDAQVAQVQAQATQQVAEVKAQHDKEMKDLEARYNKAKAAWTARIELGLSGQSGNTESLTLAGRAETRRTTEMDRLLFYLQGAYDEQNDERSKNEIMGGMDIEVDLTPRWFVFGKLFMEFDEFEDLELRARATAGLGYFVLREEKQEFKVRAGAGYQHESFDNGDSEDSAVLDLGYDYKLKINDRLLFTHGLSYYPTFNSLDDFRIVAETALEYAMTDKDDWKLRLGMRNEYDNDPVPGVDDLDTFYFLNMVLDFK